MGRKPLGRVWTNLEYIVQAERGKADGGSSSAGYSYGPSVSKSRACLPVDDDFSFVLFGEMFEVLRLIS